MHAEQSQSYLLSGADSDLDDLIASEDDDQDLSQPGKQRNSKSGRKRRSIKEKLDWSDSCSEDSQNIGKAFQKTEEVHQDTAEPVDRQHAQRVAEIAGTCLWHDRLCAVARVHCKSC